MNDLNKITNTRIGDNIHYYVNGKEDRGVVVKMNNAYVSILKGNGNIDEIHINDTFFIKDILTNKTWNGMTLEERTIELNKAHAYSPRFLAKTWEQLPQELKDVLQKTNIEESTHGQLGGNRAGISTATDVKTPEDYKGETDDRDKQTKEEFKHDNDKPTVDKNNGMEKDHKKKDQFDGMKEDWRPTGGESDKQKNFVNKSEPLWKTWSNKFTGGDLGEKPKNTTVEEPESTLQRGLGNRATSKPNNVSSKLTDLANYMEEGNKRIIESGNKIRQHMDNKKPRSSALRNRERDHTNSVQANIKRREEDPSGLRGKPDSRHHPPQRPKRDDRGHNQSTADKFRYKSYGKPLYNVTSLEKEGDGAGNSGVNSLETTGVYNARYSDNKGRYRDQQKDKE